MVELPPHRVCEDHGSFDLAVGDGPVFSEKLVLLAGADYLKSMLLVKANRPDGVSPGAD